MNHAVYAEGAEPDLHKAAEDAVSTASQSKGSTQFEHKTSSFMRDGKEGLHIAGSFKADGVAHVHKAIVFIDKRDMWLVTLTFKEAYANAEAASKRALDSIRITP